MGGPQFLRGADLRLALVAAASLRRGSWEPGPAQGVSGAAVGHTCLPGVSRLLTQFPKIGPGWWVAPASPGKGGHLLSMYHPPTGPLTLKSER